MGRLRRTMLSPILLFLLFCWENSFAQLVMMDFADSSSNATAPPPLPVITETCGDSFNKFAFVPFNAKEDHEVGRLVDFDGGPGWGPFMLISGNEKALFKIDKEGTIRVAFPFFDSDEYRLRLASINGNLICTVQINIRIGGNTSSSSTPIITNQTFEDNMAIRPEDGTTLPAHETTVLVWAQTTTTSSPPPTTPTSPTAMTSSLPQTTLMSNFSHPMANIMTSHKNQELFADSPFDLDRNSTKKQGSFVLPPVGGTFPMGPRCADPFLTVAVPSDTPVNTPITKVTATFQVGVPIIYSISDVVFDRFHVDPVNGQVLTGPQPLTSRTTPYGIGIRVAPQTRSALEFRVRASVPNGMYCETVIRVNVIPGSNPVSPIGRNPPQFVVPFQSFSVRNCQPGEVIGQVEARDPDPGDRIQYVLENANNEISIDVNNGILRVGNSVNPQQHQSQISIRAIDSTGISTTTSVSVNFLCLGAPTGGILQFSQPVYRFQVFNCNSGTIAGTVSILGTPFGQVTFDLTNPYEFALEPYGLSANVRLSALLYNGNPQRSFTVFATDARGIRAQTAVILDLQCPIEPLINQNLLGFNAPMPFTGNLNIPGANPLLMPGLPPSPVQPGLSPQNGPFAPGPNQFQTGQFPQNPNPQQPGNFLPPGGAFSDPMFRPQFPPRLLEVNSPPGPGPNMNGVPFGPPGMQQMNENPQQVFLSGELTFTENARPRPSRPLIMGDPGRLQSDDGARGFVFSSNNNDNSKSQSVTTDNHGAEDPNQRAVSVPNSNSNSNMNSNSNSNSQKQFSNSGNGETSNPSGLFGFSVLSSPQMGQPPQGIPQIFEQNRQLPGGNFPLNFGGNQMILPQQPLRAPPGIMFNEGLPPPGIFGNMGGFPDPNMPRVLLQGPMATQFSQFPPPGSPFPNGLPDLTIQLPQSAGQTPPIFVTPLCAPPNTNFIGRVRAIDPEPNDRISYFIFSTGGTDVFDVHATTGEIRSRTALTIGTYNVDVAARDSTGRTAIMRLEISINPSCLQPRMMNDFPQNGNFFKNLPPIFNAREIPGIPGIPGISGIPSLGQAAAFRPNRGLSQKTSFCAEDFVPSLVDRSMTGSLATVNHFGIIRQLSKSGNLSIKGPTVITVDAPYSGTLPVTLSAGTVLAEFVVSGGSGTYRWVQGDDQQFEITGESMGSLRTKSALQHGTYEHNTTVKDNAGNLATLKVRIVVRSPEFGENSPPLSFNPEISTSGIRTQQDLFS